MTNRIAGLLALLLLAAGCGGGGGGGGTDPVDTKPYQTAIVTAPTTVRLGEPFDVTHRVFGDVAAYAFETMIVWDTSTKIPSLLAYRYRGGTWNDRAVPDQFTGKVTAPFSPGKIYLRSYAHVRVDGNEQTAWSEERSIVVDDIPWTTPYTEETGLLVQKDQVARLGGFGYTTSDGYLHAVGGATWVNYPGLSLTVWFSEEGPPAGAASSEGLVWFFRNWTENTVDVDLYTDAGGFVSTTTSVPVCPSCVTRLRALAQEGYVGDPGSGPGTGLAVGEVLELGHDRTSKLVRAMATGVFLASATAGQLDAPSTFDGSLAALAAPSQSTFVTAGASLTGSETLEQVNTALAAYTCFTQDVCLPASVAIVDAALAADSGRLVSIP